ncbi:uncharacterized protein AAES06_008591 isoform 3-T5 [Glossophaga mutica]
MPQLFRRHHLVEALDTLSQHCRTALSPSRVSVTAMQGGVSNLRPMGQMRLRMAKNMAQHKIVLLHTGGGAQSFLAAALPMAQLTSLLPGTDVCAHPFLDEFQGPPVLRDLEQLHGTPLILGQPLTARIMSRTNSVLQSLLLPSLPLVPDHVS